MRRVMSPDLRLRPSDAPNLEPDAAPRPAGDLRRTGPQTAAAVLAFHMVRRRDRPLIDGLTKFAVDGPLHRFDTADNLTGDAAACHQDVARARSPAATKFTDVVC